GGSDPPPFWLRAQRAAPAPPRDTTEPDTQMAGGARSGLASHRVTTAVLSGAALGHDRVRDGTGWGQRALGHGHPAPSALSLSRKAATGSAAPTTKIASPTTCQGILP